MADSAFSEGERGFLLALNTRGVRRTMMTFDLEPPPDSLGAVA